MSDSEGSLDNEILRRITRRRQKKAEGNTTEKSQSPARIVRRRRRKRVDKQDVDEVCYNEENPRTTADVENVCYTEEFQSEPIPEKEPPLPQQTEAPRPEPEPSTDDVRDKLEEERKLEEAHTEAKRLKRVQTRGEVKPSSKVQKIVRKREKKESVDDDELNPVMEELKRLREEMATMKQSLSHGFNNGNQYAPRPDNHPQQMSERQSNLLMGLLGRR